MTFKRPKIKCIVLLMLCGVNTLLAQKFGLSFEAGYQYGIQTKNNNDAPFPSTLSYSLGTGISRQLMFHVYPDSSNWFFSTGILHLGGRGVITASNKNPDNNRTNTQLLTLNSTRWVSRLTYSFPLKHFQINLYAGVVLPLSNKMTEETWLYDSVADSRTKAAMGNYASVGFSGGLGISTTIAKGIKLFCNGDLLLLNSKVKSRSVTSYSDSKGRDMDEMFPGIGYRNTTYHKDVGLVRNNKDVLPASFDKDKVTDKIAYTQSYSSIGIQFGFLFLF